MQGLWGIVRSQWWMARNSLIALRHEPRLKLIFIGLMVTVFWVGALALFHRGFLFFYKFPLVGPVLIDETIYIFMAVLFIMLILSTIIICYVTYYRSEEVSFLFAKPVDTRVLFHLRFVQSIIFSSWAFLFLGLPFIISYALVKQLTLWFYLYLLPAFVVFVLLPAAISSLVVLFTTGMLANQRVRYVLALAAGAAAVWGYHYYRTDIRSLIDPSLDAGSFLNALLQHIQVVKHPCFPPYWMSKSLLYAGTGHFSDGIFYLGAYTVTALLFLFLNAVVAERNYYDNWLSTQASPHNTSYPTDRGILNMVSRHMTCLPRAMAAMSIKDVKVFLRDFSQWSQFVIYFGILALYIFNLRSMPIPTDNPYWQLIITFLNLTATSLAMAGFTVRFLFPLISLEGNKMWILGLAPITFRNIILQKFMINFVGLLAVSEGLMLATTVMLRTGPGLMIVSCGVAALASVGLVGMSVGLGSLFPSFREDNPAKIVSGFGGTLNFVLALCYICLMIFAFAAPYFSFYIHHSISGSAFAAYRVAVWIVAVAATGAAGVIPLFLGYRHLEQIEF